MFSHHFYRTLEKLNIPEHMLKRAKIGFKEKWKPIKVLFEQQTLPKNGWEENQITCLLAILSDFDSDKDPEAIRIGEREGRISTPLLSKLVAGFCHGVGRSGQLSAPQPKAAGASMMQSLTNKLVLSLVRNLGLTNIRAALATPAGTGMSLAMALRGCMSHYEVGREKNSILYCRADHRSPLKGIKFVGLKEITVEGHFGENHYAPEGSYVDIKDIKKMYDNHKEKLMGIVSTTSFFSPRVPDNVKEISKFAQSHNLIHVINNAYGIQSENLLKIIRSAIDAGRVDAIVQSTDKNFLTPVGGGLILSPEERVIETISKCYAGRASAAPITHLLVSLLKLGEKGYIKTIEKQKECLNTLEKDLSALAKKMGEHIIDCKNPISVAMTLKSFTPAQVEELGGYLYNLRVTGPRVVNLEKDNFGACTDEIKTPYIVINAAIGARKDHIRESVNRLEKAIEQTTEK